MIHWISPLLWQLTVYLYISQLVGDNISTPPTIESILLEDVSKKRDIELINRFVNMVSVDVEAYAKQPFEKSVKKTLTIPTWLNKASLKQNINFHKFYRKL